AHGAARRMEDRDGAGLPPGGGVRQGLRVRGDGARRGPGHPGLWLARILGGPSSRAVLPGRPCGPDLRRAQRGAPDGDRAQPGEGDAGRRDHARGHRGARVTDQPRERTLRALIVDYGGVLTTSVTTSFAAFCLATGVRPENLKVLLADAYAAGEMRAAGQPPLAELVVAVETGSMSGEEFDRHLAPVLSQGLE